MIKKTEIHGSMKGAEKRQRTGFQILKVATVREWTLVLCSAGFGKREGGAGRG